MNQSDFEYAKEVIDFPQLAAAQEEVTLLTEREFKNLAYSKNWKTSDVERAVETFSRIEGRIAISEGLESRFTHDQQTIQQFAQKYGVTI